MGNRQDILFRGTKDGLYLVLNDAKPFGELERQLREYLSKAETFFQGADVVVDAGGLALSIDQILSLKEVLAQRFGLNLKKIVRGEKPPAKKEARAVNREETARRNPALSLEHHGQKETLLHKGTLRSGMRIAHDGNVVVVGDVNPGAEIAASGDIIIMGSLRGLAHAGAGGNKEVSVVAFRLEPTQLRIADLIGRPPEGESPGGDRPEVARMKDGMIVVESLEGTRWEGDR